MGRLNARHLDSRRALSPRDYLADPYAFGERRSPAVCPSGGDDVSRHVALVQHRLVWAWRTRSTVGAGELCRRYGIGRNTWSQTTRGYRWAGETVLAALADGINT